jgi:two-component system response regulator MprA
MASPTVLVVDDDAPVRRMLVRVLEAEGFAVTAVGDGGAALVTVERRVPDVVVLDVAMPGVDGLAVCRRLRAKGLAVPVLLLTARDSVEERVAGLDAGADDYLAKPFAPEELAARLRALLRRGKAPPEVLAFDDVLLDLDARRATRAGDDLGLTRRELDLLALLLGRPRTVVSREEALDTVWADEGVTTTNVVDQYVGYLRRKLGPPPLIHTVRGVGFTLDRR